MYVTANHVCQSAYNCGIYRIDITKVPTQTCLTFGEDSVDRFKEIINVAYEVITRILLFLC